MALGTRWRGGTPGTAQGRRWLQLLVHCDPKVDVIPEWLVDMVLKARPVPSQRWRYPSAPLIDDVSLRGVSAKALRLTA